MPHLTRRAWRGRWPCLATSTSRCWRRSKAICWCRNVQMVSQMTPIDGSSAEELSEEQKVTIRHAYESLLPRNKALLDEVGFILEERIKSSGIKIHNIEKRIKSERSALEKCERKRTTELASLSDLVGARVICLFRSDVARIGELIAQNFEVLDIDDKQASDNSPLGYLSVHYSCKLPSRYSGPRYERTSDLIFEVQVRTLCMHAWAAVTHYLDYKGERDVPRDLKQALSALAGLFYVADSEFEQFNSARLESQRKAAASEQQKANGKFGYYDGISANALPETAASGYRDFGSCAPN